MCLLPLLPFSSSPSLSHPSFPLISSLSPSTFFFSFHLPLFFSSSLPPLPPTLSILPLFFYPLPPTHTHLPLPPRCIERVRESQYSELSSELEITKANTFLRQKDIPRV